MRKLQGIERCDKQPLLRPAVPLLQSQQLSRQLLSSGPDLTPPPEQQQAALTLPLTSVAEVCEHAAVTVKAAEAAISSSHYAHFVPQPAGAQVLLNHIGGTG